MSLNPRKLLNLCSATIATTATIARVGYTLGTLAVLLALLFAGVVTAQEQHRTFTVPSHSVNGMILLDVSVNGKPAVLLLDTGANNSIVDGSLCRIREPKTRRAAVDRQGWSGRRLRCARSEAVS